MTDYIESACSFAEGAVGVITTPTNLGDNVDSDLTVIFLNAGVIHHVGPCRLHVIMAREIAAMGIKSFRFDLSGIGDSEPPKTVNDLVATGLDDIKAAVEYLASRGGSRFVLFGLCSGANNALRYACQDERVVGTFAIDPQVFPTWKTHAMSYGRRMLKLQSWVKLLTGQSEELKEKIRSLQNQEEESSNPDDDITRQQMADWINTLVQREVEMFFVFTGGVKRKYNYSKQFKDTFRRSTSSPLVGDIMLPECDHTFTRMAYRSKLISLLLPWLNNHRAVPLKETA